MTLIELFENQGKILFRWRSYIPILVGILCLFQLPKVQWINGNYTWNALYGFVCFGISFLGQWIRFLVVGTTPSQTSGRNTKTQIADTLNQTGMYSLVRNPLYLGNFLMYLGVVLLVRDVYIIIIFLLFFAIYYERIIFAEESFLKNKFGNIYIEWASKTPVFIPKWKGYIPPSLPMSWKTAIRREYQGLFGFILVYCLFDIGILYFNQPQRFSGNFFQGLYLWHKIVLSVDIFLYTIIRFLHKKTKFLLVEGRW